MDVKVLTFFAIFSKCLADFKPLSLGHQFRGFTKSKFSNPKQPIDLIDIPIFSESCGLFKMN